MKRVRPSALDKKLLRELWQMRGQVISIAVVVACGMAVLIAMLGAYRSIDRAHLDYYEHYRFADVFASLKRAPRTLEGSIRRIPGVVDVEMRATVDVKVALVRQADPDPIVGRLLSIPTHGTPALNRPFLRKGRPLDPQRPAETWVNESFADAHHLELGDEVDVIINGRWQRLHIVGVALSPEYVFAVRGGDIVPNDKSFAVFWMGEDALGHVLDMAGAFNDVALSLGASKTGASEREAIRQLDVLLEPYGGVGAHGRDKQLSALNVKTRLDTLQSQAKAGPILFLGVAAFLLNVMMLRIINAQRPRIAALKALGFSNAQIAMHYVKFVLAIALLGSVLGIALGAFMGEQLTVLYGSMYRFPSLVFAADRGVVALAVGVSVLAALTGALGAVRRAVKLPPAEAMRPEAPKTFKPTVVERLGLQRFFSQQTRMILRQMERHKGRTIAATVGIAFAVAIVVITGATRDGLAALVDFQFREVQREDFTVLFRNPLSADARRELAHVPGVVRVETTRTVPARLWSGHRFWDLGVTGLPRDGSLHRLIDAHRRIVPLPDNGVILTKYLGERLGVHPGDSLRLEMREGANPMREVTVMGFVEEWIGVAVYMNIAALNRAMNEEDVASGAYLSVDGSRRDRLVESLRQMPNIASIGERAAQLRVFTVDLGKSTQAGMMMVMFFAVVIAVGVVYNNAQIAFMERAGELGSLRVLGFTRGEISALFLGELAIQVLLAIPLGCGLGWVLGVATMANLRSELYRFPVAIEPRTLVTAGLVVVAASVISGLLVRRKLDRLDLVEVLKSRE